MISSEPVKNARLTKMRLAAGGLLSIMVGLYIFSRSYQSQWPSLVWLRALSEAGMVGGLADWFAVTALFRHPLGLPIPHTAIIPREKDRIGDALARFVKENFLTGQRISQQARELHIVQRIAKKLSHPADAKKLAQQTIHTLPAMMESVENHPELTHSIIQQLHNINPATLSSKLINWLLSEKRYRQLLAPLLGQTAMALAQNKSSIESAATKEAPLSKTPLLGAISRAIVGSISERATENLESKLIAASKDPDHSLWDIIHTQLETIREQLSSNPDLQQQLEKIRDEWLSKPKSSDLTTRLWQTLQEKLTHDLARETPHSINHLTSAITSLGNAIHNNPELATNIENTLLDVLSQVLEKHGSHLETMIQQTIAEWDAATLMQKLESQVGPDLQFIRINGTLIGGLVGIALHALGIVIWHSS